MKNAAPSAATHPNTFAWFVLVGMFHDTVRNTWTGAQSAAAKKPAAAAKPEAKKEEPKVEEPKKEEAKPADDDMDLFGDDEVDEVSFIFNRQTDLINI